MKQAKISKLQFFYVMVGFEVGTVMIFGAGGEAKQDAWVVIVTAMISSLLLMGIYTKLVAFYPDDTLVQMMPKIIGRFLSFPLILIYIFYFTYLAARGCRDLGELIASTILVDTPIAVVIGSFIVLMIYCLRGGIESFGRMGEVVFPIYMFSLIVIWILLFSVESFDLKNLSPVLGHGVKPIVKEAFPGVLNFPFGELIIITMFFPFLDNKQNVRKLGMIIILAGGVLFAINVVFILSVLGPEIYRKEYFPLLSATRIISIADFLERFDALVILMIVGGVFFKVGGCTFGAAVAISQLFKLKQTRSVLLALGLIITPLSLVIASDFIEHIEIGLEIMMLYIHVPLQIIIPLLLLSIAFIRKKFQPGKNS